MFFQHVREPVPLRFAWTMHVLVRHPAHVRLPQSFHDLLKRPRVLSFPLLADRFVPYYTVDIVFF